MYAFMDYRPSALNLDSAMMSSAFSDTSATNSPTTPSDDGPLLIIEDSDLAENKKFTNDDPLDLTNFPPLPNSGANDVLQTNWQDRVLYPLNNLPRSRHVSESSTSSLSLSRAVSENSGSSISRSRLVSESSATSLSRSRQISESSCSSLPRSRQVSESSISPLPYRRTVFDNTSPYFQDEFTTCEIHSHVNEFFCNDCGREICKDCATRNHQDHSFRPGYTYMQMFSHYRLSRNSLQEHKVKCERVVKNLNSRFNSVASSIRAYFQKIHEITYARERKLLEDLKRVFEHRKLLVGSRSFEAEKALMQGDQIMDVLSEACKAGNTEKSTQAGRFATKHLDSMRELARKIDVPIDDVSFVTHQDDASLFEELKTLGSIVRSTSGTITTNGPSDGYNNSWSNNCFSWNGTPESNSFNNNKTTTFNEMNKTSNGNYYNNDYKGGSNNYNGGTAYNYNNQPSNTHQTQFVAADAGSNNYNPFTSFVPPELPVSGSPVENLAYALAALRSSSPVAVSQSPSALPPSPPTVPPSPSDPLPSSLSMLPFCNATVPSPSESSPLDAPKMNFKSSANINIPSNMNSLNTMSLSRSAMRMDQHPERPLQWNRGPNDFKVSYHRSRNYSRIRKPVVVFGQEGKGDTDLCRPWGVCCDDKGHVIVADRSNNRIQIFRTDGTHVRHFGVAGSEEGQFNRPAGVAMDLKGRIVVCDKDNHRIQVFTLEGALCLCFGRRGSTIGQFNYPWDVAVAPVSGIYAISDTRNHRIQMFTDQGSYIKHFGFENHSPTWKLFDSPRGVCFTPESTLMCTDFNSHRLFEIDFMVNGARMIRLEHYKKCQLYRPQKLTMDHEGNILVTDCRNNRVVVFARDGRPIATFGVAGKENGQFDRPSGLSVTPDGKVVVVDFGNHRIQVF